MKRKMDGIIMKIAYSNNNGCRNMTRRRIMCRAFMLMLIATTWCMAGVGVMCAEPVDELNKTFGG